MRLSFDTSPLLASEWIFSISSSLFFAVINLDDSTASIKSFNSGNSKVRFPIKYLHWVECTVTTSIPKTTPVEASIQSVASTKGESVINWIKHIPSSIKAVVKGNKIVLTGAASMIAQIYQQARFPFFSKDKKSTVDVDLNGKAKNNGKETSFYKAENSYDER